jgi:thiol-disulfide isomerase/thioredoxin
MLLELELRSLIVLLLAAGLMAGCDRQSSVPVQANAAAANTASADEVQPDEATAAATPPATEAGVVKPDFSHAGEAPPAVTFTDPAGKPVTLASFKGKPLLVNLWATWCAPCIAELPTLDALAKREAGKLVVLTVSQDTDAARAAPFLAQRKVGLPAYTDAQVGLSVAYAANLPTTIMYGADGKERWRLTGGMDWSGADAAGLIARGM